MTSQEQLNLWVAGESRCKNDRGECCPDFSCCVPALQWDEEKRKRFAHAVATGDDGTREKMLMGALGAAIEHATGGEKKVHVTRGVREDHE